MLHGVDVHARYQKGLVASSLPNVDFVVTKVTGGTDLVVDGWQSMLKGATLTGVYHYSREKHCQGTAAQEAEHFISQAKLAPKRRDVGARLGREPGNKSGEHCLGARMVPDRRKGPRTTSRHIYRQPNPQRVPGLVGLVEQTRLLVVVRALSIF